MQYLCLIYGQESARAAMNADETGAYLNAYREFTQGIIESGEFKAGEALEGVATATTVRVRDGKTLVTDGPFAETKEQLGGFYLVECDNLDQAITVASKIPTARHGSIEVRPIKVWDTDKD